MNDTSIYTPQRPSRVETLSVRGVDYAVHEWGEADAPLLMYLHGWGDTGATFQFVVDALKKDWHVVAPDWRGFGRSAHNIGGYWFPDYLADLDVLLETYSPAQPATLVGHSMGGNVASLYGGVFPERVDAIVNIEGFGLDERAASDAPAHWQRWIRAQKKGARYATYRTLDELLPRIIAHSPSLAQDRARFIARQWTTTGADGVVQLRADPAHKLPNAVLYRRAEAQACWAAITARMLLVVGQDSGQAAPGEAFSAALDAGHETPRVETVEHTGHMVHFEAPEPLAGLIESFV